MIRTQAEAEDYIYHSYMKVLSYLEQDQVYAMPDREKRSPDLLKAEFEKIGKIDPALNILVTGSKGKGSVAGMMADLFREAGFCVGLFTSPHVVDYRERIKVNGNMIPEEDFVRTCEKIRPAVDAVQASLSDGKSYISPIGISALLAFTYFHEQNTEINIFECGKGALHDDVTRISHSYSVLTTIFPEHLRELGPTLSHIITEKAGVVSLDSKVLYVGNMQSEILKKLKVSYMI